LRFTVTLVQMPCFEGDRPKNFAFVRHLLKGPSTPEGPEFILLPELFAIGLRHEDYNEHGPGIPGSTSEFLAELAEERGAFVIGTGIEENDSKYYNTLAMATDTGKILGTYRKIHPFQEEKDVFRGGDKMVMFDIDGLNVGVQICYDIRFPEVTRKLALEGAHLVLIPAAFPDPRSAHWDTLVMARAIENQLYVAATNRVGPAFDGKTYFGHSQIVDPWGLRLSRMTSEAQVLTTTCDTSAVESARSQITCYADRSQTGYDNVKWFKL